MEFSSLQQVPEECHYTYQPDDRDCRVNEKFDHLNNMVTYTFGLLVADFLPWLVKSSFDSNVAICPNDTMYQTPYLRWQQPSQSPEGQWAECSHCPKYAGISINMVPTQCFLPRVISHLVLLGVSVHLWQAAFRILQNSGHPHLFWVPQTLSNLCISHSSQEAMVPSYRTSSHMSA